MNVFMGFVFGFIFGLALTSALGALGREAEAVKAACEASLPRDEHCVLTYVPAGRLP